MSRIEVIFGSLLALFLVGAVAYAGLSGRFWGGGGGGGGAVSAKPQKQEEMTLCGCYRKGFDLSAQYDVQSSEYSTGFVLCRQTLGEDGGRYFTAGWKARQSAKPWESTCEAYERNGA